ncbi:hypothetical protein PJ985_12275 [Streptomyces sp. ACA25]|uniref:tyrosine-type recombinase/integrase n=1 Tax=Streptomyces sp. ACA25 TaxID=3022596 RepID=UPI0023075031|nr:hypothetical protein [Streptomyces sp. ACA25]MDB1088342.1 hypothetical protein [Streptomyces sp. ACA25]
MRSRIWNHIIPLVGDVALKDIDAAVLRAWKAQLLTRVDESTAEVIWIHLSTILAAAVDDGRLLKNPCKSHRTVKPPKRAESKAKAWDRPTTDAVRASLQERYRLAVGLGVGAGLRQGEAFGLGEDDIDEDASVIRVRRQLRWDHRGRPYFCLPKGKKAREVPLSPALVRRARARMARFPTVACTLPWRDPEPPTTELEARQCKPITVPLVLNTSHGKRINYATFNDRRWKRVLAAAGVITVVDERAEEFGGGYVGTRYTRRRARTCSTCCGIPTRASSWRPASRS